MSKIDKQTMESLREMASKLPNHNEKAYNKDYKVFIDSERHFKRIKKAYKKNGNQGAVDYVHKYTKTVRKRLSLWGIIKYRVFGIKPFDLLIR